ncbi:hypothetical protein ACFL6N_07430 [Thermodesulfobacteriota bacterium]
MSLVRIHIGKAVSLTLLLMQIVIGISTAHAAEQNDILVLRPDLLKHGTTTPDPDFAFMRDPFKWPREQISVFETHERARQKEDIFVGLRLNGILWDNQTPMAIINNQTVGIGDVIGKARVTSIFKNEVLLTGDGKQHVLSFPEGVVVIMNNK